MSAHPPTALIMAGGTGGHIFPGLAVALALQERGWRIWWLGAPNSMEARLVPLHGFELQTIDFGGVRGKGKMSLLWLPLRLLRAFWQALQVVRRTQPAVLVGLGGYISFPGGMMGVLLGRPLVLHEQNSVAGMANKVLSGIADRRFCAFPGALSKAEWVGNPLRQEFLQQPAPAQRFAARQGPLKLLVIGGSLGARALNDALPQALALLAPEHRPQVLHQSGEKQIAALQRAYEAAGVKAELTPFIDNTAAAMAEADVLLCRAGASTVTEVAAIGAAALFVPFPHAVDDHQTHNAQFLTQHGGGWLWPQTELSPERLAEWLLGLNRSSLLQAAERAHAQSKTGATAAVVAACEALIVGNKKT